MNLDIAIPPSVLRTVNRAWDELSLRIAVLVFFVGSTIDTTTTYVGLNRGLSESTQFVVLLMDVFGIVPGLVVAKVVAGIVVLAVSRTVPYPTRDVLRGLAAAYGMFYAAIGVRNLALIWFGDVIVAV